MSIHVDIAENGYVIKSDFGRIAIARDYEEMQHYVMHLVHVESDPQWEIPLFEVKEK